MGVMIGITVRYGPGYSRDLSLGLDLVIHRSASSWEEAGNQASLHQHRWSVGIYPFPWSYGHPPQRLRRSGHGCC